MINGVKPSAVCAFTSAPCNSMSSVVVFLPITPSMVTFFSSSPAAPPGGSGALTAYIKAVQPALSTRLTIDCLSRRCATTCVSALCAAHIKAVVPSVFVISTSARLLSNSTTQPKCPRSAAKDRGDLPEHLVTSVRSALAASSCPTTRSWPFTEAQVSAEKPSPSLAPTSAPCLSSHRTVSGLHCVAAMCRGVAPLSSLASRSARCLAKCSKVTTSSM
mmetsp:Transcript_26007/g.74454  ORF Transcript_26007/g.74454 Transcript_26007/m.74454 type:complete len:218 (-) Transcript_26007:157-810(-)